MPQSLAETRKIRNGVIALVIGVVAAALYSGFYLSIQRQSVAAQLGAAPQAMYLLGIGMLIVGLVGWFFGIRSVAARQQAEDALSAALAQASELATSEAAQNQILQRQIVQLLDEVSSVAEGNLTVQAEVHDGALGAVADSFNYMITELRQIIGRVNGATQQVGTSTDEILTTTDVLSRSAEQQAARIADTSTAVEEMAVSIQQVSENAAISARVAREARNNAESGTLAVAATIAGMARVRQQVQETTRKIERLATSSQEIDKIVGLIRDVADQTQVLALNAAIQAAAAGEHGKGFAVVADEVRRLAQRTTTASGQIATLVKGIQAETSEAIAAMNEGNDEVTAGAHVAEEAGQKLGEIDSTATQLAELIEAISLAAEQQARASAGIARAMGEISSVTTSTTAGTQQAASSIAALAALADDLRASVAAFRLDTVVRIDKAGGRKGGDRSRAAIRPTYASVGN